MRTLLLAAALVPTLAVAQVTTSDRDLENVAEAALSRDPATASFRLRVEVSGGRARVRGTVDTLQRRWDALDTVGKVRGIVSVEDGLAQAPGPSDGAVEEAVLRALRNVPSLESQALEVRVSEGVATLSGTVTGAAMRLRAREAAARAAGVRGVVLRVEAPSRPDGEVAAALERVLGPRSLTGVPGEVRVAVSDGEVSLSGSVPTVFARSQAERVAWGVDGVRSIRNAIVVVP